MMATVHALASAATVARTAGASTASSGLGTIGVSVPS
jgi:hypothetical protein